MTTTKRQTTADRVKTVLRPLEGVVGRHLGDVTGPASLALIVRSIGGRALSWLEPADLAEVGLMPDADRAFQHAYLEAFRQVAPDIFGTALSQRVRAIETALEEGLATP